MGNFSTLAVYSCISYSVPALVFLYFHIWLMLLHCMQDVSLDGT